MKYSYFQFIVLSNIPFMHYFSENNDEKKEFYHSSVRFIQFIAEIEKGNLPYTIQLVIPPIFLEIVDDQSFQREITEFLENDRELIDYWNVKEHNINKV
ncbi:MAG TPA: hypothetical protein VNR61_11775, partial [Niallia sp.]|nr:hypothetical protein [Niallia sp.]